MFWMSGVPLLVDEFRPWNDVAWAESIGQPAAAVTACNVTMMRSIEGTNHYIAKYLAKPAGDDVQSFTGRVWGVIRRDQLPVDMRDDVVAREVLKLVVRVLVKMQCKRRLRLELRDPLTGRWWTCARNPWGIPEGLLERGIVDEPSWYRWFKWRKGQSGGRLPDEFGWADGPVRARLRRVRVVRRVELVQYVQASFDADGVYHPGTVVPTGDVEHVAPSLHFLKSAEMERLLAWAKGEYLRRLEEAEGVPF